MRNNPFNKLRMNQILIYLILGISFIVLSFAYLYSKSNVTVINYSLSDSSIVNKVSGEFIKGKRITGQFNPKENYLGQVLIRFYTYNRINTDSLTFRIRQKGSGNWYYEHTYKTDQFLPDNLFTFGFPVISDSKGKTYEFEIESVDGTPEESVTLSKVDPLAALSFQYPKSLLIKNPSLALTFLMSKIKYQEINSDVIFSFLIYLNFIILVMLLEYLLLKNLFRYKFKNLLNSQNIIVLGLFVMLISVVILYLKKEALSLNITVVAYFILIVGVGLSLIESKRDKTT